MSGAGPRDVAPLDPGVFARAVIAALAAGETPGRGAPLALERPDPAGGVTLVQLPDSAHARAAFALKRHFAHDEALFAAALPRFRALMDLFARGTLEGWTRHREGARSALHPAVIDVASRMRLSRNGRFAPRKFLEGVAGVADRHYPELEGWGDA